MHQGSGKKFANFKAVVTNIQISCLIAVLSYNHTLTCHKSLTPFSTNWVQHKRSGIKAERSNRELIPSFQCLWLHFQAAFRSVVKAFEQLVHQSQYLLLVAFM